MTLLPAIRTRHFGTLWFAWDDTVDEGPAGAATTEAEAVAALLAHLGFPPGWPHHERATA